MKLSTTEKTAAGIVVLVVLGQLTFVIAIVYVAIHFLAKWW